MIPEWDIMWRAPIKIDAITFLMSCSSKKRLLGDPRALVQQRTAQWFHGHAPMAGTLPKKDPPGPATNLSHFLRRTFAGRRRYNMPMSCKRRYSSRRQMGGMIPAIPCPRVAEGMAYIEASRYRGIPPCRRKGRTMQRPAPEMKSASPALCTKLSTRTFHQRSMSVGEIRPRCRDM